MSEKKAKPLMIQGTMSGAGKSLIVTALCRIFKQDGYSVAPFKSQNMALNSCVTTDGGEIGRAQAVQAEAAGKPADVRMNPILLKPVSDRGSQVILNGKVIGDYEAKDYFRIKKDFIPHILRAYESLEEENDIIVIEGAGSPAEINLRQDDIVNMGLAQLINAPVLLAGNIDPGGVFAQLYGTAELLERSERERIRGFIINKFRGDISLLEPGIRMIEEKTGIKVIGTIPYTDVDIDDEDSLSGRLNVKTHDKPIDIAVIRLKHISNFTDIAPLEREAEIGVRYVSDADELCKPYPDMIIIPGTKNTMADLMEIRENSIEAAIKRAADKGVIILGICGGYQMLGQKLSDPCKVEGNIPECEGMGLLPINTVFDEKKTLRRTEAEFILKEGLIAKAEGYEIHMGRSERTGGRSFSKDDAASDSTVSGSVYGTYLHGLFDSGELTEGFVRLIAQRKGIEMPKLSARNRKDYREEQYDLLAETVRKSLDMERIYDIIFGKRTIGNA